MKKVKVLFLAAYPDASPLKLDEEIREITKKVRESEYRDTLKLVPALAVRPDDLLQTLNEHKPHIVHFSGHGSPSGEIILIDENLVNGKRVPKPVSPSAIRALFLTLKDNVQVVLLNACYSQIQAEAIRDVVDCVIGMNAAVGDRAAITFAASFYRALGFGRSIQEAFEQGKVALLLEGIPEHNTPELLCKPNIDPSRTFVFHVTQSEAAPQNTVSDPCMIDIGSVNPPSNSIPNAEVRFSFSNLTDHIIKITSIALKVISYELSTEFHYPRAAVPIDEYYLQARVRPMIEEHELLNKHHEVRREKTEGFSLRLKQQKAISTLSA